MGRIMDACDEFLESLPGGGAKGNSVESTEQLALNLAVEAMAVMCVADGSLDGSEIETKQEIYRTRTGHVVDEDTIRMAVASLSYDSDMFWHNLKTKAGKLTPEMREDIYRAAAKVAAANKELHDKEVTMLKRLADALGVAG